MKNYDLKTVGEWLIRTRVFIILPVCAIVFYLGYSWDISSLQAKLKTTEQEETSLKQQFEILFNKEMTIKNDIAQLPALKALIAEWQAKLVKPSDLPEVLNEILKIGTANQLQFNMFNPGAEVKEDNYFKVPIKVIVIGGYEQIANFLSQVANMPWIVVVDNFTIISPSADPAQKKSESQDESHLISELNLIVYHNHSGQPQPPDTKETKDTKNSKEETKPHG